MKDKFYIIDYGKDTVELAESIIEYLKENGNHIVIYLTDLPSSLMVNEITQDEFLDHFTATLKDKN
jgi:hypothetical protein